MKQYRNIQNIIINDKNAQCVKYGMLLKIKAIYGSIAVE